MNFLNSITFDAVRILDLEGSSSKPNGASRLREVRKLLMSEEDDSRAIEKEWEQE